MQSAISVFRGCCREAWDNSGWWYVLVRTVQMVLLLLWLLFNSVVMLSFEGRFPAWRGCQIWDHTAADSAALSFRSNLCLENPKLFRGHVAQAQRSPQHCHTSQARQRKDLNEPHKPTRTGGGVNRVAWRRMPLRMLTGRMCRLRAVRLQGGEGLGWFSADCDVLLCGFANLGRATPKHVRNLWLHLSRVRLTWLGAQSRPQPIAA